MEPLAQDDPVTYQGLLVQTYNNFGIYYSIIGRISESEEKFKKSINKFEPLAHENKEVHCKMKFLPSLLLILFGLS